MTKPILKWVGGKTQILDRVLEEFPKVMNDYREIFLGGGSVLLGFLDRVKDGSIKVQGRVYAYDFNGPLIYVYKNIQSKHEELFREIQKIGTVDEERYYELREIYNKIENKKSVRASALFIVLNKTCFRGVFRVGPRGFNVPFGHYKNPEIINRQHLENVHNLIKDVIFECMDFKSSLGLVKNPKDFVYLDPPYASSPDKKSFVGYTKNGFDEHIELFKLFNKLPSMALMSNADVQLVRDNTKECRVLSIECRRSIDSKHPESKANEVLVINPVLQSFKIV